MFWVLFCTELELLALSRSAGLLSSFDSVCVTSNAYAVLQVEDLKRFMPQIIHIVQPGLQPAAAANKNVGSAKSLTDIFSFTG